MSDQQAQSAIGEPTLSVDQESAKHLLLSEALPDLAQAITFTQQGLRSEVIGGCGGDALEQLNPLGVDALKEFYVRTACRPEKHGKLTEAVEATLLSAICVTQADADRADEARATIAGYLETAEMMEDSEVADGMRQLARMEMPFLVPNVLHVDKDRVIRVIQQEFSDSLDTHLRRIAADLPELFQEAYDARRKEGMSAELPLDPEGRRVWLGRLVESAKDRLDTKLYISLTEAFTNNLMHGNKGDPEKIVSVFFGEGGAGDSFVVCASDQGEGFVVEEVRDPTSVENLNRTSGRGIKIISEFLSEVSYSDGGRTVTMRVDFDAAVREAMKFSMGSLHELMRKDALKLLSNEIVESEGKIFTFVSTAVDAELGVDVRDRLEAVCQESGDKYSFATDRVDFADLRQQVKEIALNQAVRSIERGVREFVTKALKNEYHVDLDVPWRCALGCTQKGERTFVTVASNEDLVHELTRSTACEFPARRYSPPDTRIKFFSTEGIGAFLKAGVFRQLPSERVDIDVQGEIEAALKMATNRIVRRHFKVEAPAEATDTTQE